VKRLRGKEVKRQPTFAQGYGGQAGTKAQRLKDKEVKREISKFKIQSSNEFQMTKNKKIQASYLVF